MSESDPDENNLKYLAQAPVLIFLIVAAADGSIDKKEVMSFIKVLGDKEYEILFSAMQKIGATPTEIIADVQSNISSPLEELISLRKVLDTFLPKDAAHIYKIALLKLAKAIAEASGGFLGIFGNKISKEEKAVIAVIASSLGLLDGANGETKVSSSVDVRQEQSKYTDVSQLPDNLYPALKKEEWAEGAKGQVVMRCIYPSDDIKPNEPVIGYVIDCPETVEFLNINSVAENISLDEIHTKAMENLNIRLSSADCWEDISYETGVDEIGEVSGLILVGDYFSSEALLSEPILKKAHEILDAALLLAVVPVRGELFVTKLISEETPEPSRLLFAHFAVARYFNLSQAQISPNVWIVRNGKLAGHVAGMDEVIESAKKKAIQDMQEEDSKLVHSATTYHEGSGISWNIAIVSYDLDILIKNLHHVIREYVHKAIEDSTFTGILNICIDIKDPEYEPGMKDMLAEQMNSLFDFLNNQFASLGCKGAENQPVRLAYSFVD